MLAQQNNVIPLMQPEPAKKKPYSIDIVSERAIDNKILIEACIPVTVYVALVMLLEAVYSA